MDQLRLVPHQFFERYAGVSLGPASEKLAEMYAPAFIVGGPRGSMAFANDSRFLEWLRQVHDFNRTHGMHALVVVAIRPVELSPLHVLATVTWGARFAKSGERLIEFEISYLLEKAGNGWKVLAYLSQRDQDEEMKKEGLA